MRRRRVVKVKRARPAEMPLGEGGRERAMDILRLLAASPLSEEFRKPVVQMHPEVRFAVALLLYFSVRLYTTKACCCYTTAAVRAVYVYFTY